MKHDLSIVWLRRDLRLEDNSAISRACEESKRVMVIFVFDSSLLPNIKSESRRQSNIELKPDRRVTFIYDSLVELNHQLKTFGSGLICVSGDPVVEVPALAKSLRAQAVYFNEDYEPNNKQRDQKVQANLKVLNIKTFELKDHVIFSGSEISKSDGSPYRMFTPYKNFWLKKLSSNDYSLKTFDQMKFGGPMGLSPIPPFPKIEDLGIRREKILMTSLAPGRKASLINLEKWSENFISYQTSRDFPGEEEGTSGLSTHLRFGTISIRECVSAVMTRPSPGALVWLSELIWRDFYQMILDRFPHVVNSPFKKKYDKFKWQGSNAHFKAWCEGRTGFPIVDAGMRQLNQLGWMHNRLRMITASFLVKDLLVDWRRGEAYFAEKLLDFDLAANNGGWQWCASTGCDAQPYFRIFNPVLQSEKFDPECDFIKKWVPELSSLTAKQIHLLSSELPHKKANNLKLIANYPRPIVSHSQQKMRALTMFRTL